MSLIVILILVFVVWPAVAMAFGLIVGRAARLRDHIGRPPTQLRSIR